MSRPPPLMATLGGDWGLLATMHRPNDAAGMTAAARNLIATGLKPRDVATTLGITEHAVSQLLSSPQDSPHARPR